MTVNPRNTSRTCPVCGHVSADNRTTQAKFACVSCGHQAHADVVGAINILARGMQNMRHGGKDMPPNACIESFVSSPCEEMEETTCTYDLVFPEGHAKEIQGFPLRGNRDSSHGGDVSHAKLARVKHASPMKQEPTEVILQDEYLEERRRNPRSIMGRWPMVFRVAKEGRGGCQEFVSQLSAPHPFAAGIHMNKVFVEIKTDAALFEPPNQVSQIFNGQTINVKIHSLTIGMHRIFCRTFRVTIGTYRSVATVNHQWSHLIVDFHPLLRCEQQVQQLQINLNHLLRLGSSCIPKRLAHPGIPWNIQLPIHHVRIAIFFTGRAAHQP